APDGEAPSPPATTEEQEPPPPRSQIALVVLNGTDVAGLAGDTALKAESLGYSGVVPGNAPTGTTPTTVYFAGPDAEPAARRVAADLEFEVIRALPAGGEIATAARDADPEADVVVVLGP
ncbi:MAG: LytR C-terminal domain-containing protein, partial [Miltoncostaeaceae bacterium]